MYCLLDIVRVCIRPKGIFPNKKLEKEIIEGGKKFGGKNFILIGKY